MIKKYSQYINESFKIGDRVAYDTYWQNFDDPTGIERGTIIGIEEDGAILVRFDKAWTDQLHDGNGEDPTSMSYWCSDLGQIKKTKPPKIVISAEDPYGEEDWEY